MLRREWRVKVCEHQQTLELDPVDDRQGTKETAREGLLAGEGH